MNRIFLLSPAHSGGKRAALLTRANARFELARQVQISSASLGDVFSFCSGLYFRGKLTYARHFAAPPPELEGVHVITPSRGLLGPDSIVGDKDLAEFATVPVDSKEARFTRPLRTSAERLAAMGKFEVVLLGSIATGKYLDTLAPIFGERLLYPCDFAGRGDMSRGALLLRSVRSGTELIYVPVPTPAKLRRRKSAQAEP